METVEEYVDYGIIFALSFIAVSAAYFFDISDLRTYPIMLLIPVLFGFTAEISKNEFNRASLMSLFALIFVPINFTVAIFAVIIALGNVLVSFFAGGNNFKEFYSSTALPLLLTGSLIGLGVFYGLYTQPDFKQDIEESTSDIMSSHTEKIAEEVGIDMDQEEQQKRAVRQVSEDTLARTQSHLMYETYPDLEEDEVQKVQDSIEDAEEEVPEELEENVEDVEGHEDPEEQVGGIVEGFLTGNTLLLVIPLIALSIYSLQPLVGLITAFFASIFFRLRRN